MMIERLLLAAMAFILQWPLEIAIRWPFYNKETEI
jgi:hypothetical protein